MVSESEYSPRICLIEFIVLSSAFEDGPAACGFDEVLRRVPGKVLLGGSTVA